MSSPNPGSTQSTSSPNIGSIYTHQSGALLKVDRVENGRVHYTTIENTKLDNKTGGEMSVSDFNQNTTFLRKAAA